MICLLELYTVLHSRLILGNSYNDLFSFNPTEIAANEKCLFITNKSTNVSIGIGIAVQQSPNAISVVILCKTALLC